MGAFDRDALLAYLSAAFGGDPQHLVAATDRILALLRPVDGVTLTREEAALAAHALRKIRIDETRVYYTRYLALADRLEAAS